jgi:hypothetical protein
MDTRKKILLSSAKSREAVNLDTYINFQINGNERLLPPNEINRVLDLSIQFNKERQECKLYRISGKINPLISNVLFNITGSDSWEIFSKPIFTSNNLNNGRVLSYSESIKKHLKEVDGWYGYNDPVLSGSGLCNFFDMEPKRKRFSFLPDTTNTLNQFVKNWELTITYPFASDKTHYIINGGVLLVSKKPVLVGGKPMTAIATPIKHNFLTGSSVRIKGTNFDGDYEVKRLGLDDGTYKDYYFCIDIETASVTLNTDSRVKKIYKGFECEYYFRLFKKVKTKTSPTIRLDDYEIYNLAFSENVYSDEIVQFIFNDDIDVNGLVDNLNRPLSELFLTVIKTSSNRVFTDVASGIEAPDIPELRDIVTKPQFINIPIIQLIHTSTNSNVVSYKPLEMVNAASDGFYGDIVEYNKTTLNETVLSTVVHRFNTVNRETQGNQIASGPRVEGYFYPAHHQIKIRDFSAYIEQGDENTIGMPEYAVDLGDGRFIWRDLLDIGTTDLNTETLNYPFVNGYHYIYQNYLFDVKRQDPFDKWNMFYGTFPMDPIGNTMTNNFKINSAEDVC